MQKPHVDVVNIPCGMDIPLPRYPKKHQNESHPIKVWLFLRKDVYALAFTCVVKGCEMNDVFPLLEKPTDEQVSKLTDKWAALRDIKIITKISSCVNCTCSEKHK